jgi:uncharacterized membrane protein
VAIDQWAPPLAILAGIFYLNRGLAKNALYFGCLASGFVALILGAELPWRFAGIAWLICGAILFELGTRKDLLDFRLQGYGLALLGAGGTAFSYLDPHRIHNAWAYGVGTALSLAVAIRATRWLRSLREIERRLLRIGGALSCVILGALFVTRLTPESYWGLAMLGISLLFVELALRRLPEEMWLPAVGLNLAALARLLFEHAAEIHKHPSKSVWIGFTAAAVAYYCLTARLLRDVEPDHAPVPVAAPWFASVLALVSLWMVLPDAYLPVALGAFALLSVEAGLALEDSNLILNGQAISLAAIVPVFWAGLAGRPRMTGGAVLSALHYFLWHRNRRQSFAFLHGWTASVTIAVLIGLESPFYWLALWALFGAMLAAAAGLLRLSDLRWQAAALAFTATFATYTESAPAWQHAAIVAWFLLSVVLEKPDPVLRGGYSIAAALVTWMTLLREVSGGLLTLSWSGEGIALLALGFALRERTLRLSGLFLLLLCIAKVFFYDLRNLETVFRILSFIGLGVVLLLVSWIYTRFKDQLQKYL